MAKYGLLIEYEDCTGCHTCEIACKEEHGYGVGEWGIKLVELAPARVGQSASSLLNLPVPTELCDLCERRTKAGDLPSCVRHCQAAIIRFGTLAELSRFQQLKPKTVIWAPR